MLLIIMYQIVWCSNILYRGNNTCKHNQIILIYTTALQNKISTLKTLNSPHSLQYT